MRRDEQWKPQEQQEATDQGLKCLAQEVEALQNKLNEMRTIGNGQGYWAEKFRSPGCESYDDWEEVHRDVDRAWKERDCRVRGPDEYGGDRALAWRDREFQGAGVRCGDRVFPAGDKEFQGAEVRCGDRAFAMRDGEYPGEVNGRGDRAEWHGGHWLSNGVGGRDERGRWDEDRGGRQPPPPPPMKGTGGRDGGEDRFEDQLRSFPIKLPVLPEPSTKMASLEAGDWLTQVKPLISDVSGKAGKWWDGVINRVTQVYLQWLEASPLERLKITAPMMTAEEEGSVRLAQRVTTMLLEAVPQTLRTELIATRKLEVNEILFYIHKVYQPGGVAERQQMLQSITMTKEAVDPREAVDSLRLWKRQMLRCRELKLSLPDGLLRIQALDRIMNSLLKKDGQASFRISTFRLNHKIDVRPEEGSLDHFFDLLLAEAEYMMTSAGGEDTMTSGSGQTTTTNRASVKSMMQNSPGEKGGDKPFGSVACRWWGSDRGCKMGKQCKFSHDGALQDKSSRCWLCSSKEHRRMDCPTKDEKGEGKGYGKSKGGGEKGEGKGYGKSKSGKQKGDGKSTGTSNNVSVASMTGPESEKEKSGEDHGKDHQTSGNGGKGEEQQASTGETLMSEVTSLLKSLRTQNVTIPQIRACGALAVQGGCGETLLDGGATHCLRTAGPGEWEVAVPVKVQLASTEVEMRMHPVKNTLLVPHEVQAIVPIGKLTSVGYKVQWESGRCEVVHRDHGRVPVKLHQGCPVVDKKWGQKLMKEVEAEEERMARIRAVCLGGKSPEGQEEQDVQKLKKMFPEVPATILEKIPGLENWDPAQLPFNRHRRRQIEQAKTVVINLFAGKDVDRWKKLETKSLVIVNLDVLHGGDLLKNPHLAGWLQSMAKRGKVSVWTAGPPCRSVSWCRYREEDGGPPPLRTRNGKERFGMEKLEEWYQEQVQGDTVMFLRTLWWFRLSGEANKQTQFALEQPMDPEEWVTKEKLPKGGAPSFMVWKETQDTMKALGMKMIRMDQGALGHRTRKPTMVATTIMEVEKLDGIKGDSYTLQSAWKGDLRERIQQSKNLAQWAPGFCDALKRAILRVHEGGEASMKMLSMKERREIQEWQDHFRCGHMPFRKDCETCQVSAGRDRPRRKLACPTSMCLSVDLMGPFVEGKDQEGCGMKYGMVAVYTVPINGEGAPLPEGLSELRRVAREESGDLDEGEKEEDEQPREDHPSQQQQQEQGDQQEELQLEEERKEDDWVPGELEITRQEENERKWKEFIQDRRATRVKNITFVVPIRSRASKEVIRGVSKIYGRVRAMQLPVTRLHTDRAREFSGREFQDWCQQRDLYHTMSPGDEATANSRAEREIGWIKPRMRSMLLAARAPSSYWPLALRQAGEERMRIQIRSMGIRAPGLLPFGAEVVVKKKTWHQREDATGLKWPMKKATIFGPASDMSMSSKGYYVKDQEGRFFRTTVVHHVWNLDKIDEVLQQGEDQRESLEEEKAQVRDDAPGNVEDATWDVVEEPLQEPKRVEEKVEEMNVEGRACQERVMLEEIEIKKIPAGPVHDPPRYRHWKKTAPVQRQHGQPVIFKVATEEEEEGLEWSQEDEGEVQLALRQHQALVKFGKELVGEIEDGKAGEEELNQLRQLQEEVKGLEVVLKKCEGQHQQVLDKEVVQTRLVSMDEVRKNMEEWKPAFQTEVDKLKQEALEPITERRFREMLKGEKEVECLPMKAIASLKPPAKHKGRVVVCGNFAKEKGEELDNAASGIDSVAIRTALNVMVQKGWRASTTDVTAAFLTAPRRTRDKKVTICEPPYILKQMGIVPHGERWIIHQALYGLQESPGDWGYHRDMCLESLRWKVDKKECWFERSAERHLWRLMMDESQPEIQGYLLVYVDDMMVIGSPNHMDGAIGAITGKWQCSNPDRLEVDGPSVRFCGFELKLKEDGLRLTQEGYLQTMLERREVEGSENQPLPKIQEEEETEEFEIGDLRKIQALVGEVLWMSTRTRPDISFAVGALGRMLHKRPRYAWTLGQHLLRYLNSTREQGLWYSKCRDGDLGDEDQLQRPRTVDRIDVYSDISYGPSHESYRSVQGIGIEHGGNLIVWESSRQSIVAMSTCEAELIGLSESHQVAHSILELLRVFQYEVKCTLHSDSRAAISASTAECGSWRTRHLRLRSNALREELRKSEDKWKLIHLRGENLLADGWTKPLIGQAFERFLRKLRMFRGEEKKDSGLSNAMKSDNIAKVAAVGGALTMLACAGKCQEGWKFAVGAAAGALLVWSMTKKQEAEGPTRPEKRPHKDPNKIQEERDHQILELGRSGTATLVPGTGTPEIVDHQKVGENSQSSNVEGLKPGIRAFRMFGEPKSSSHGEKETTGGSGQPGRSSGSAGSEGEKHPRVRVDVEELAEEFEVKVKISKERRSDKGNEDGREGATFHDCHEERKGYVAGGAATTGQTRMNSAAGSGGERDRKECPYMLPRFQAEPVGSADVWEEGWIQSNGWLVRVHKKSRVTPFHPLHRSTPVGENSFTGVRVTKIFQNGRMIAAHVDDWRQPRSSRFDGVHGQWKGYTFFEIGDEATGGEFTLDEGFQLVNE